MSYLLKNATGYNLVDQGTLSGAYEISPYDGAVQLIALDGDASFTVTNSGLAATEAKALSVIVTASGGERNVTFDSDWKWAGTKPAAISSGVSGILSLLVKGTAGTDIVVAYEALGDGT